jgi:hypothetical protein
VDSHAVTKRLQSELMSLMASADAGVSAFPAGDSLLSWLGTIHGAKGTVYEGLSYKLSLTFPTGARFARDVGATSYWVTALHQAAGGPHRAQAPDGLHALIQYK